ncbi:MAG: hypothetical protein ACLGI2_09335 [Acidimicrobiia bacterium]
MSREITLAGWRRYVVDPERGVRADGGEGPAVVVDGVEPDLACTAVTDGPERVSWRLEGRGVAVEVTATGDVGTGVVHTDVTVAGTGRLERVDVERGATVAGLGQPVLGPGWFAGVEHPGAEGLSLAVDVALERAGPYRLPPAVAGRAEPGFELSALWDEVDRVRARPPGLIVLANNWYQLGYVGRMDESTVGEEVRGFEAVAATHDLPLDFYCLDDPWDGQWEPATGLWGRLAPDRFPGGLDRLLGGLGEGVRGLGLWVSPWGGYFDRHDFRVAWGRDHGYETEAGPPWDRLCPAGDAYGRHLAESMARHTAAGVRYWKIDGVQFDCARTDHGHGGRTDQMDRFAALLDGVRAVGPGTVLTFTSGSNPSPWWLRHADFVWRGGLDDDAPESYEGGRHERFATYIDGCLDALRTTTVPVSSIVTFSVVENEARAYRDAGEDPVAWARHCWLLAGRGTHHHDLYVAPGSLSEGEWAALAEALRWARANQAVLARSRMIGGRPQAGEPYGFLSEHGAEAVLCVRNPRAVPQAMALGEAAGLVDVEPVFPRGRREALPTTLDAATVVELGPFDVLVVSARGRRTARPGPPG